MWYAKIFIVLIFYCIVQVFPQYVAAMNVEEFFEQEEENNSIIEFIFSGDYEDINKQIDLAAQYNNKAINVDSIPKIESSAKVALYFSVNSALLLARVEKEGVTQYKNKIAKNTLESCKILDISDDDAGEILKKCAFQINTYKSKKLNAGDLQQKNEKLTIFDIVKNSKALSEIAKGKSFPVLSATKRDFKWLDDNLYRELSAHMSDIKNTNDPIKKQIIINNAWNSIGLSFDATLRDTFRDITPDQYRKISRDGTFNLFLMSGSLFSTQILAKALEQGVISRDSAQYFLEATAKAQNSTRQ